MSAHPDNVGEQILEKKSTRVAVGEFTPVAENLAAQKKSGPRASARSVRSNSRTTDDYSQTKILGKKKEKLPDLQTDTEMWRSLSKRHLAMPEPIHRRVRLLLN